jgi:D-alanyl-D-alanine carboxypeptidase
VRSAQSSGRFEPRSEAALIQAIASLPRRLAQPLALRDTSFDLRAGPRPQEAMSQRWNGRWTPVCATDASVPLGADGVISSPRDLVLFMRALFDGRWPKPATSQLMSQTQDRFGLGIYKLAGPGPAAWGHEGSIDGFSAALAYFPSTGTSLAWCGNGHQLPREDVVRLLRRAVFEPAARLPSFNPVQATVDFAADAGQPPPAAVSVRGNAPALSWDNNLALTRDAADSQ